MKTTLVTQWSRSRLAALAFPLVAALAAPTLADQQSQSDADGRGTQQPEPSQQQTEQKKTEQQQAGNQTGAQRGDKKAIQQNGILSDAEITAAVQRDLAFDSSIDPANIKIENNGGILTLTGTAPNLLSKERAGMVAEAVRGVRWVDNNIQVQTAQRTDEQIRTDVLEALRQDPAADAYEIAVEAKDGAVTLSRAVDSWQEREVAEAVAKRVKGVQSVINELRVDYKSERPDGEISADVRSALERDVWIRSKVDIKVNDGRVSLSGTVGSVAEKRRVQASAHVAGVKSVDDSSIKVDPSRKATEMANARTTAEIERDVKDAFIFDPRVNSFNPKIAVTDDGTLTLTGTVDNLKAKRAARQVAQNTKGVRTVKNQLEVRSEAGKSNDQLVKDVGAALARDPFVDRYEISLSADNGKITLDGTVDSNFEKWHADDVASRVSGVMEITNNLTVQNPTYTYYSWPYSRYNYEPFYSEISNGAKRDNGGDAATAEAIRTQMFWSPFVDADQVQVSVSNGIATLNGRVNNWGEYNAAVENAYEGGANQVESNLEVRR